MSVGGIRFNSGKSYLVGYGTPVKTPIDLDPEQWEGALIYTDEREMYFSDGDDWVIISGAPIRRPFPLEPITAEQKRQLRLSAFLVSAGYSFTQTGIIFKASLSSDMTNPFFYEVVNTTSGNMYELPSGFLPAGTTFWWQGKYLATDNQESQFSKPYAQVFPDLIATPIPITPAGATALALSVEPFESSFGYIYGSTTWELYTGTAIVGPPLVTVTNTSRFLNLADWRPTLVAGATYYWRAKFTNNTTISSNWSALRAVVMDQSFQVKDVLDASYYVGRTIPDSLLTPYQVPSTVLNSAGTPFICP